jgi:hypothetical protein
MEVRVVLDLLGVLLQVEEQAIQVEVVLAAVA